MLVRNTSVRRQACARVAVWPARMTRHAARAASARLSTLAMSATLTGLAALIVQVMRIAALTLVTVAGHPAAAATLQISPVMVELGPKDNASGLTLRNPGEQPLYGQVRVYRWTQVDGDDVLSPTQEIVASPPLIQIPAQAEQLVRLVRPAPDAGVGAGAGATPSATASAAERNYRLLIDELSDPGEKPADGVTIRLRYSVPVFVEPPGNSGTPQLKWTLQQDGGGWELAVENIGTRRAQISAVELVDAGGAAHLLNKGLLGYALAGQARRWHVTLPPDTGLGGAMRLRAAVNATPVTASIRIEPRP
jgi:fimbrial chaperone protein